MFKLSGDNPSPFVQPFLELILKGEEAKKISKNGILFIDVNGKIDKYITDDNQPTELLIELCQALAKAGVVVTAFDRYEGSGGASVIMRHGVLFNRMSDVEDPPKEIFAYGYREPTFGRK